ncbi:hypothetical protein BDU57DRAFT_476776 [Ampelomyces quisqualis]|uniref:Uncharacterized protein n=1 Tax=Ampelomyces quisqualis TaxID=50730 RepID=A0A6A5QIJ9_AMPQU|nr:hypothetical protein BDU57DRAFT_476776 [Ampelomyces quisqualis]
MRPILTPLVLAPLALSSPNAILAPFETGLAQQFPATSDNNSTLIADSSGLFARQNPNACATNYLACAALNAPGLCCPRTAICTADANLNPACCPQGAQCTGTLLAPAPASPTRSAPPSVSAQTTPAAPRSTVQNPFYPFPYIPTTYPDAIACSAAYSSCARDAATCTTALANGAQGVAVSAPNGAGVTITAVPSVGLQSAQSICASLSALACSGLQVEACRSFGGGGGNAAPTRACGGGYWMGVGVVVGVAGGLLR